MKTNSFLTSIFVAEKARKRAQRVNPFKAGGREIKTEVVSITDLLMQSVISREG